MSQQQFQDDLQVYERFLMEVLEVTAESKGDAKVIYSLLRDNINKLNHIFAEILRHWATMRFRKVEADLVNCITIAALLFKFGDLIQQFPLGDKASNIEIAIVSYETVLKVFTRQTFTQQWAMTQHSLAIAYSDRINGDKAQNIENAIAVCEAVLQVYTQQTYPQDWAMTQNNLGNAYRNRIKGDKADNIEQSISAYKAALTIRSRQTYPQDWAMTQNNLGKA